MRKSSSVPAESESPNVQHDTSRGRTSLHPAHPGDARTGRPGQAHAGRPGPVGKALPAKPRPAGQDRPHFAGADAEGPRLRQVVEERGPLPAPRLRKVALRTAAALAAMHRAGVVHGGFDPGRVLLGPDGAQVIDFAAPVGASPVAGPGGAPAYMAPEEIEDEPVGPPADVFAWGATMVFAATGRPPFGTGPGADVMRRVTSRPPDLGDMAGPLRDLAARCLDKNPAARPTAPRVVRALREGQGPMPRPRPTRIPRYRWRMMVALAAVVASGFLFGMLF